MFVAHELEGRSFKEMAAETGVSVNTLLSRKLSHSNSRVAPLRSGNDSGKPSGNVSALVNRPARPRANETTDANLQYSETPSPAFARNENMAGTEDSLRSLLANRAVVRGRITLSSGIESEYYFDCKRVTLSSEGAPLVGEVVLNAIKTLPDQPRAIGGLTHGADPIIGAAMMKAAEHSLHLDGFYVRKEPKKHGTQKLIENAPPAGTPVVIVDDVVTKGGSVVQAIDGAESTGCKVVAVIVLVDRLEGGTEKIRARVPQAHYIPVFTIKDFLDIEEISRDWAKNSNPLSAAAST